MSQVVLTRYAHEMHNKEKIIEATQQINTDNSKCCLW